MLGYEKSTTEGYHFPKQNKVNKSKHNIVC